MSNKSFYITSPIFYPNANLHMGHAYTMTVCDILARYHKLIGDKTYFLTGADENTGKIIKAAADQNKDIATYLNDIVGNFKKLFKDLEVEYDQFIKTTDKEVHWPGAIAVWNKLVEAGDIYKGVYEGLYCPSCEAFYTEKDLVDGKCPLHGIDPQHIKEENYFFRLSKYTEPLKEKIKTGEFKIIPEARNNEIVALLERGLEDVSFSRPHAVIPHGIPVPNDPDQVIYVWCDALVNYISALGYGRSDDELFKTFWPVNAHVIGKDILRFHGALWPAMLMSAGIALPKAIFVHGFITSGGRKMSKSLGNIIDPLELIAEYGPEALRYYFAREVSPFEDGDLTKENFKTVYNAHLANGIGNLVSRVLKMAISYDVARPQLIADDVILAQSELRDQYHTHFESFEFNKAAHFVWEKVTKIDQKIQETQPFKLFKTDPEAAKVIVADLVNEIWVIATLIKPFLPTTAEKIKSAITTWTMPEPLFLRK
jgi:methionyl-tRNA synthetase